MGVDLHIHSNLSLYGKWSVERILARSERKGLKTISICDNNSVLAHVLLDNIDTSRYFSGKVVPGVEIDVYHEGIVFQILGYGFDVYELNRWVRQYYGSLPSRQTRIRNILIGKMTDLGLKFDKDYPWNPKREYAHANVLEMIKQYPENKELLGGEIPKEVSDFFALSTHITEYPLYIDLKEVLPSLDEAANAIHEYGGLVSLPSPYQYRNGKLVNKILKCCKKYLDAVEVFYPTHTKEQIAFLKNFADKNHLLISGGSDFQDSARHKHLVKLKEKDITILQKL